MSETDQPTITNSGTAVTPGPGQKVQDTSSIWYNINTALRDLGIVVGFFPVFFALYKSGNFVGIINTIQSSDFLTPLMGLGAVTIFVYRQIKAWKTEAKVVDK